MRRWVKAGRDYRCGYDWCAIKEGDPMQVVDLGGVSRVRCIVHAQGPVDWDEIAAGDVGPVTPSASSWQPVRGISRRVRTAFDAKARQAGEE